MVGDAEREAREREARERVAVYAVAVAERLGRSDEDLRSIRLAAQQPSPHDPAGLDEELCQVLELARRFDGADGDLHPEVLDAVGVEFPGAIVEALRAVQPLIQPIRDA